MKRIAFALLVSLLIVVGLVSAALAADGQAESRVAVGVTPSSVPIAAATGAFFYQQAYLKASNTGGVGIGAEAMGDYLGYSVAISGNTMVVGAPGEDSNASGVNGNQNSNSLECAGAAYVFVRTGTTWSQQAYLKASNPDAYDFFGDAVAISGDTIVVGADWEASAATGVNGNQSDDSAAGAGAVYVFVRTGTTWTQQAYLKASNAESFDHFGRAVAISADTVIVGAEGERSDATGVNGNQHDEDASYSGAAYVFVRTGTTWTQQAYLKASNTGTGDAFGCSVAISGNTAVVGAVAEDSSASGVNGPQANDSAANAGAAYVFVRTGTAWAQQAYLKASNAGAGDHFGESVALSGDSLVVGASDEDSSAVGVNGNQTSNSAPDSGAAYVFKRTGTTWTQQAYLKASTTHAGDAFGWAVALSGDTAAVGAALGGVGGAAYVYTRSGSTWTHRAYVTASNPGTGDWFGRSIAVYDGTLAVGAPREDSGATGVNGNQSSNSAIDSGAAYVFVIAGNGPTGGPVARISGGGRYPLPALGGERGSFRVAVDLGRFPVPGPGGSYLASGSLEWSYEACLLRSTTLSSVTPIQVAGYPEAVLITGTAQLSWKERAPLGSQYPATVNFVATLCDSNGPFKREASDPPDGFGIDILGVTIPGESGVMPVTDGLIEVFLPF